MEHNSRMRHARMNIGTIVAGARLKDFKKEFYKVSSYVDGCHLPGNCKLKLEEVQVEDRIPLPGLQTQYRLEPAEHCERENLYHDRNDPVYQSNLEDEVLMSLRKIKENRETDESPKADMWCHLGTSIITVPDEGNRMLSKKRGISKRLRTIFKGLTLEKKKVSFRERDDIHEDILKRTGLKEITEDNEYISRYDLTYLTPCFYQLRCKVWVAKSSVKKKLEDIPIPFSDVKNVLEEIQFEDETTQSRCRGWLVLKSRKYLQTDILFPGCELDCRFTIRERRGKSSNFYVPEIEVRRALSTYLSRLTLTDKDTFGLLLPDHDLPEGFHLLHKRCCKRKMYSTRKDSLPYFLRRIHGPLTS
ncbi:unnamed protein product [Pocillopora meandrina]|uniref:Uncharacterized protein n=1 Tax=Pocillopora meandrina TaxID=46732 RepID=A0AAU9Y3K3_9CNID|nr:unnamed protein product [Pocillopora meandrina]